MHVQFYLPKTFAIDVMDAMGVTAAEAAAKAAEMNNLAAAYYITAQGVPFIHAGEEMLRSKPDAAQENGFNHNSYASGDAINSFKWGNLANELNADAYEYYKGLIAFRKAHPALRMTTEAEIQAAMSALETGSINVEATSAMILVKVAEQTEVPSEPTDPSQPSEPTEEVDTTELEKAIKQAKALKKSDYTKKTWDAMQAALKNAEKVLKDEDATQEEVDAAADALNKAIKALAPATGKNPSTGDNTQITLVAGLGLLCATGAAALVLNRKKLSI